jgi:hypothetical protein
MAFAETLQTAPSVDQSGGYMIPQYVTSFSNRTSKFLLVGGGSGTHSLVIGTDGTLTSINNPESLASLSGGAGCPVDNTGTKAFYIATGFPRAYLFDWSTNVFTRVADPPVGNQGAPPLVIGLNNGTILYVANNFGSSSYYYIYTIASNTWSARQGPLPANGCGGGILLPNGKALVNAGSNSWTFPFSLYDPSNNTWISTGNTPQNFRFGSHYILLNSGNVGWGSIADFAVYSVSGNFFSSDYDFTNSGAFNVYSMIEYENNKVMFFVRSGSNISRVYDISSNQWSDYTHPQTIYVEGDVYWRNSTDFFSINAASPNYQQIAYQQTLSGGSTATTSTSGALNLTFQVTGDSVGTSAASSTGGLASNINGTLSGESSAELMLNTIVRFAPVELRLRTSFPLPTLEMFRTRALAACSSSTDIALQVRAVALFAYDTELRAIFDDLIGPTAFQTDVADTRVNRLQVDNKLANLRSVYEQAFDELTQLGVPRAYQTEIRTRLESSSFSHRVSAICTQLLLAALLLQEKGL